MTEMSTQHGTFSRQDIAVSREESPGFSRGEDVKSLAHALIDAALAADLSQNELRAFLALFRQTLCYGKTSDPLTHKRLVTLTHIRKDRLIPALNALVEHRLFTVHAHKTFGQRYQIHTDFLANPASPIYAPHLTEKPNAPPPSAPFSEKQKHTTLTETALNLDTTHPPVALPYPASFSATMRQAAARLLDGLSPQDAQDCLLLLTQRLSKTRIQSPLGYLHQLAQAARQQRLDRSALKPSPTIQKPTSNHQQARLQSLALEIQALDRLYTLAGMAMDAKTAAKRQAYYEEYERLKQAVSSTCSYT